MSRRAKPWYRKQTDWWMVILGGRRHKLVEGKQNQELAWKKFHELMLVSAESPGTRGLQVASLCEAFLAWTKKRRAAETYRAQRFYIQSFAEQCGYLTVDELHADHLSDWVDSNAGWKSSTTHYNAYRHVFRVFNWAVAKKHITVSPFQGIKRPPQRSRERCMTDAEYRSLLKSACPELKWFLFALRNTGARPSELRQLTWDQVQDDRWILPTNKTSTKTGRSRVIYLTPFMTRLMVALRKRASSHSVFVNTRGAPWTTNAIRLQIARLKKKLGLADDVCAYLLRHAFGTNAILNGVDALTVAELMGHSGMEMVKKVYVHLAGRDTHMMAALQKAVAPVPK